MNNRRELPLFNEKNPVITQKHSTYYYYTIEDGKHVIRAYDEDNNDSLLLEHKGDFPLNRGQVYYRIARCYKPKVVVVTVRKKRQVFLKYIHYNEVIKTVVAFHPIHYYATLENGISTIKVYENDNYLFKIVTKKPSYMYVYNKAHRYFERLKKPLKITHGNERYFIVLGHYVKVLISPIEDVFKVQIFENDHFLFKYLVTDVSNPTLRSRISNYYKGYGLTGSN
jgi:hypothetical protein